MLSSRRLFLLGALCWLALAVGHPVVVDLKLALDVDTPVGFTTRPDAELRALLASNVLDFGRLGSNTALRLVGGFSLWLAAAALALGAIDLAVGCSPELPPRLWQRLTWINAAAMIGFTGLALTCFIYPPQIVGSIGSLAFLGSAWLQRGEARATSNG
jgi:hypothetical protein